MNLSLSETKHPPRRPLQTSHSFHNARDSVAQHFLPLPKLYPNNEASIS